MDFTFSAEQDQLRDAVRSFLESKAPSAYVRSMMEDDRGITDEVWDQLVELGWTEITDLVDLTVVLEEMGKLPFPGPYLSAAVLAPMAA
ncbi:MAG: acyl-CoA dehydrogenase family protein, partial [Actinobacteria bacterium]|nr:acyl-CoA dehydrogenase family protein [Actinomycetota bacterium]